jgi:hypothetical protein
LFVIAPVALNIASTSFPTPENGTGIYVYYSRTVVSKVKVAVPTEAKVPPTALSSVDAFIFEIWSKFFLQLLSSGIFL